MQRHLTEGTEVYRENDVSGCPGGARGTAAGVLRVVLGLHFRRIGRVGVLVLGSAKGVVVRPTRGREGSTDHHVELVSDFPEPVVRLAPLRFESAGV